MGPWFLVTGPLDVSVMMPGVETPVGRQQLKQANDESQKRSCYWKCSWRYNTVTFFSFCKTFEFGGCGLGPSPSPFFSRTCRLLEVRDVEEDTLEMAAVGSCPGSPWQQRESVRSNQSFMQNSTWSVHLLTQQNATTLWTSHCGHQKCQFLGQFWSNMTRTYIT